MPFTSSGKRYALRAKRFCGHCMLESWQLCAYVRYGTWPEPTVPASYRKEMRWICEDCGEAEDEIKQVYEPSDRLRIINHLLNLNSDYDFVKVNLSSEPDEIVLRVRVPDFDPSEMRAIKTKQQETGFITVDELMRLQKAGFNRPREVPPKPQPKSRRVLRERARQRIFQGEPRSI